MLTGIFYIDTEQPNMLELLNIVDKPLAYLSEAETRPSRDALAKVMAEL
jgi:hypothetical protein